MPLELDEKLLPIFITNIQEEIKGQTSYCVNLFEQCHLYETRLESELSESDRVALTKMLTDTEANYEVACTILDIKKARLEELEDARKIKGENKSAEIAAILKKKFPNPTPEQVKAIEKVTG